MAYGGTGLPIPNSGDVLTQTPPSADAERLTNARAWGQIAQVGEHLAQTGLREMKDLEHQRQVGYLADRENAVNTWTIENRAKSAYKPDEFQENAAAFRDGVIANVEPWAVPHISKYINQHTNSAYAGILHEKLTQDRHNSQVALDTNIQTAENDMIGAAKAGLPTQTFQAALEARLQAAVTAGFRPPEWAAAKSEMAAGQAMNETAGRSAVQILNAPGPEGGYEAAVRHLQKNILENQELKIKPQQKEAAFRHGLEMVRREQTIQKADRSELTDAAKDMTSAINAGDLVGEDKVRDMQAALARSGAWAAHRDLTATYQVKTLVRGAPVAQLAQVANAARVNAGGAYMTGALPGSSDIVPVTTPGGLRVNVHRQAAPAFGGFLADLEAAGAPVKDVGGYNPRNIAGTNTPSQHAFGNAIDIDQTGRNISGIKAWGEANRDKLAAIEAKWGMRGGQNFSNPDWGHWEWTGGANKILTGQYPGEIAKRLDTVLVKQVRETLPNIKDTIARGEIISPEDMAPIRYAAAVANDQVFAEQIESIARVNEFRTRTRDLPIEQRQAAEDAWRAEGERSGLSPVDLNYSNNLVQRATEAQAKKATDDPIGYSIDNGWGPPKPLDLSTMDTVHYGLHERILRVRGVAEQEHTPVGIPLRPAERHAYAAAISGNYVNPTTGKRVDPGVVMSALETLPDDMIGKVLGSDEIKTALTGAVHSADPTRYTQAMTLMSTMWKRQPDLTAHIFGSDALAELKNWETNGRYMNPEQLAEDRKRKVMDPQAAAREKELVETARTQIRAVKFDDVFSKFDTSYGWTPGPLARALGSQPLPPSPTNPVKPLPAMSAGEQNAFMGDFETQAAKLMAGGMKKDDAVKHAVEMMKTVWKPSPINGNRLMRDAPEFAKAPDGSLYNPLIDGSQDWMKNQLEGTIAKETGKPLSAFAKAGNYILGVVSDVVSPWQAGQAAIDQKNTGLNYQLVPDERTKAEIQRGVSPSYNVVVQDKTSQKWEVMKWRMQFSVDEARAQSYGMQPEQDERRNYLTAVDDAMRANIAAGGASRALIRQVDRAQKKSDVLEELRVNEGYLKGNGDSDRYPTKIDAGISQGNDLSYGDKSAGFFRESGAVMKDIPVTSVMHAYNKALDNGKPIELRDAKNKVVDAGHAEELHRAWLAVRKSPVAYLGFDPRVVTSSNDKTVISLKGFQERRKDREGAVTTDQIWYDRKEHPALVHESIHRGLKMVEEETGSKWLFPDEVIVRALMQKYFGDIENDFTGEDMHKKVNSITDGQLESIERKAASIIAKKEGKKAR